MEALLDEARTLAQYGLCDCCLGRQFAKVEQGITNQIRGQRLRRLLGREEVAHLDCWLCNGITAETEIKNFASLVVKALSSYEYDTFLIGCKIDEEMERKEELITTKHCEPLKREINREVGKHVLQHTGKKPEFIHPDIVAVVDTMYNTISLEISPIFLYGRYTKLVRGIPQTKWFCRKCRGNGCDYCNHTGKMYEESIEELVACRPLEIFQAKCESFHGAGREDIDVLMLGDGRPFVLEIIEPKKRHLDLENVLREINEHARDKVLVSNLRYTIRDEVQRLKSAQYTKTYRIKITFDEKGKINEAVSALSDTIVKQRTPTRVAHRRADKIRCRKILEIKIEELQLHHATLLVKTESGTYIKELVTGDCGKTVPSLSELAGVAYDVDALDVIEVGDEK